MISPFFSDVLPGPVGDVLPPAMVRLPFGPDDHRLGAGRHQRRHAVGGGRGVAEIAGDGAAALHLLGADQIGRLDDARPCLLQRRVLAQRGAGDRGADREARSPSS